MKSKSICLLVAAYATLCSCGRHTEFPREISEQLSAFESHTKWLKELPGPEGAAVAGFGGGAANDYRFWNVQVDGAVSRDQVLAFYLGELSGLGWLPIGELQDEPVAIRSFRYLDEESRPWHSARRDLCAGWGAIPVPTVTGACAHRGKANQCK